MRKRQRPTHFTIAVKLQNIGYLQYWKVLTSWKNLEHKRALETREGQYSTLSGIMGAACMFLKRGRGILFNSYSSTLLPLLLSLASIA